MDTNLTIPAAAARLGVTEATIRAWVWRRKIAYRKIGRAVRIPQSEIDRINNEGMRPALEGR